jgi:N-methylhydantoinase B
VPDRVALEILTNRFQAVVDEMAQVLHRTAHTVFVKETQDYGTVLVSPGGEVFAAPRRYGVLMMIGMPMADAIAAVGDAVAEDDVFITNDPEATKGMVTHLSDVFLWKPLYHQGRLVCFAWTFIHMSDVGGRVPGSIAPSSTEVYQEGIRVPPRHLYRKGALDRSFLDLFLANTRTPNQNWGDMKACLAALATAERRVAELIRQYGVEHVREGIPAVLDYAEVQARRIIAHVPDGTYRFSDCVEADMVGLGLVRINLALTVKGDELLMDFTGTAPQIRAALNLPSYGRDGHWMLITALCNWLCTLEPSIAYNAGLVRPFKVKIPKGTIINPEPGAAYGARYSTSHKVCDVTIGALAQAVPNELPATDSGQGSILLVSVPNLATGGHKVSVIQPIVGGSGARPTEDGVDGTMVLLNFLKNVPTEVLEREMPEILIRHYGLRPDSGGPGKYRGGTGIVIEFETRVPYTTVTSRSMERYIFPPPGRMGGSPGTTGYTTLNPDRDGGRDIGKIDVLHLEPGDVLRIGTQGGGGFGDPLARPAEIVAEDVRNGFVSIESAAYDYGVVLSAAGMVDEMATREERARIAKARGWTTVPAFSFGAARERHYALWTDALYDALDREVAHLPSLARGLHYRRIQAEIDRRFAAGLMVMPGDITAIAREVGMPISM